MRLDDRSTPVPGTCDKSAQSLTEHAHAAPPPGRIGGGGMGGGGLGGGGMCGGGGMMGGGMGSGFQQAQSRASLFW